MGKKLVHQALAHHGAATPASRVSTLELFFDLVFVFAVTQLTSTLLGAPGAVGLGRAVVLLSTLLWIYGAFAWLTNAAQPRATPYRLALLLGMASFLIMALAIPHVFAVTAAGRAGGVGFGLGFVAATLVHGIVFFVVGGEATRRRLRWLLPRNLALAGLVVLATALSGTASTVVWLLFVAALVTAGVRDDDAQFQIQAEHFAERMGLLVIIVLGESVVAVGAGALALPLDARLVVDVVVGLGLCAALWWCYFARDDEEIAHALAQVPSQRRSRAALLALGYPFLLVLGGIVLVAAGLHEAIAHPGSALQRPIAAYLALGVAAFLAGTVVVRLVLRLPAWRLRLAAAALAGALAPVGALVPALVLVCLLTAVVVVLLVAQDRMNPSEAVSPASRITDGASGGQDAVLG